MSVDARTSVGDPDRGDARTGPVSRFLVCILGKGPGLSEEALGGSSEG